MKKKYIIGLLLLIVGALVTVKMIAGEKEQVYKVKLENPIKRTITENITANGKIQPEKEVKISADVSGEIIELYVKEGDKVELGQKLLKINPEIYLSQIERVRASVNASKAQMLQSEAQLLDKQNQFKRQEKLWKQQAISDAEYELSETNLKVAQANYKASKYSVLSAEASLKEANENLKKTSIYSPMSGTVSMLNVENGERVVGTMQMTGTEIMRIANLHRMEVKVDVNENDIVRVKQNDTAFIEVDAYLNRKFKGLVTEIANSANISGSSSDQVTNFEVKILILESSYIDLIDTSRNNQFPFRPGMSASVDIRTQTLVNVISLPIEAVTVKTDSLDDDKLNELVFVSVNGKAEQRFVETGIQNNQFIVIKKGLKLDDEVVVAPYSTINKKLKEASLLEEISDKKE